MKQPNSVFSDLIDHLTVRADSSRLYNPLLHLPAHDVDDATADAVISEFLRHIEANKKNRPFVPDQSKDSYTVAQMKQIGSKFDLRRFMKYRKDNIECRRLLVQLEWLGNMYSREMEEINELEKGVIGSISGSSITTSSNTINSDNNDDIVTRVENSAFLLDLPEMTKPSHTPVRSKGVECVIGIIKRRRRNLLLIEEIQSSIVGVIEEGRELGEFIKRVIKRG
ncbi:hypothetical protein ECANGB1_625 [Enterospora canceri]|uniref:Uncharacterized protein n=1 Tax=Enterospora canceri TaxID=1081671 RepID=A0A1Y1S499_9MICR|nr:hypothetical protein ECANGB1_625 [Enterospora canceri]